MSNNHIKFYHISRDATLEVAKIFEKKGIVPGKGKGYGGQRGGFYCWSTPQNADKYFHYLLSEADAGWLMDMYGIDIKLKQGKALKLEISVDKKDICLPDWQLDNEQNKNHEKGRYRSIFLDFWSLHKDLFSGAADFEIIRKNGEVKKVTRLEWNYKKDCPIIHYTNTKGIDKVKDVTLTDTHHSYRTQAINDYLCQISKRYKDNYNQLILAAVEDKYFINLEQKTFYTSRLAIKYCGSSYIECQGFSVLKGVITFDPKKGGRIVKALEEIPYKNYRLFYKEQEYTDHNIINNLSLEEFAAE